MDAVCGSRGRPDKLSQNYTATLQKIINIGLYTNLCNI